MGMQTLTGLGIAPVLMVFLLVGCAKEKNPIEPVVDHFQGQGMTVEILDMGQLAAGSDPVTPMMQRLIAFKMGKRLRESPSMFDRLAGKAIGLSGIRDVETYVIAGVPVSIFAANDEVAAGGLCAEVSSYNAQAEQQLRSMRRMEAEMSSYMAQYGMSSPYELESFMLQFTRAHCKSKGRVGVVVHSSLAERQGSELKLRNRDGGRISLGVSRVLDAFDKYPIPQGR